MISDRILLGSSSYKRVFLRHEAIAVTELSSTYGSYNNDFLHGMVFTSMVALRNQN